MKTKLGISTGAMAALAYLASLFAGYTPLVIIAGYVLIAENDEWLRRMAVKAVTFTVAMSLLSFAVSLVPYLFNVINDVLALFDEYFYPEILSDIVSLLHTIISVVESVVLAILGIKAFSQSTLYIPVVDSVVNKIMG